MSSIQPDPQSIVKKPQQTEPIQSTPTLSDHSQAEEMLYLLHWLSLIASSQGDSVIEKKIIETIQTITNQLKTSPVPISQIATEFNNVVDMVNNYYGDKGLPSPLSEWDTNSQQPPGEQFMNELQILVQYVNGLSGGSTIMSQYVGYIGTFINNGKWDSDEVENFMEEFYQEASTSAVKIVGNGYFHIPPLPSDNMFS